MRDAIQKILTAHEPYPAAVVNRQWNLVAANRMIGALMQGISPVLLAPPLNVLRASLHPDGLAPRIANFDEWSAHLLTRLHREVLVTGDPALKELHDELRAYPGVRTQLAMPEFEGAEKVFVPLRLRAPGGELEFFSTVTIFGTAVDITLAELAIEAFYPANSQTAEAMRNL